MALIKFGQVQKIATAASAPPKLTAVEQVIEPKKDTCIYFRARAISAGNQGPKGIKWNYNGNYDYFSRDQLEAAYQTFCGRNLFLNHDTTSPLKAVGRVLDSYPVEDPETGEFYIECLARVDRNLHPELAAMIENGDLNSVSMGASCESSMCSVCGHTIHSDEDMKCSHLSRLGQEFPAEVDLPDYGIQIGAAVPAFAINQGLTFSELSIVSVPADSAALIKTVIANFRGKLQKAGSKDFTQVNKIVAELDLLLGLVDAESREAVKEQICKIRPQASAFQVGDTVEVSTTFPSSDRMYNFGFSDLLNIDPKGKIKEEYIQQIRGRKGKVVSVANTTAGPRYSVEFSAPLDEFHIKRDSFMAEDLTKFTQPPVQSTSMKQNTKNASIFKEAAAYDVLVWALGQALHEGDQEAMATTDLLHAMKEAGFTVGRTKDGKDERQVFYTALHRAQGQGWVAQVEPGVYTLTDEGKARYQLVKELLGEDIVPGKGRLRKKEPATDQPEPAPAEPQPSPEMSQEDTNPMAVHESTKKEQLTAAEEEAPEQDAPDMQEAEEEPKEESSEQSPEAEQNAVEKLEEAKEALDTAQEAVSEALEHEKKEVEEMAGEPAPEALPMETPVELEVEVGDSPLPEMPEMVAAGQKPQVTAQFTKQPFLSRSFWTISVNKKPIIKATLRDICGEHLSALKSMVTSDEYGKRLVARVVSDGPTKVASLLNVTAEKDMEHLWGKDKNQKAHEKGHNEVVKMHEQNERDAEKSRKAIDRPYGEPGDHLKAQAAASQKSSVTAAKDAGYSPALKDSNAYEKGHNEVVKAHEQNEREAEKSKKAIDRPYGEPGDHISAEARAKQKASSEATKTAAKEEGYSPEYKGKQKDYEKGHTDMRKAHEQVDHSDPYPSKEIKTSYEAGEHLKASQDDQLQKKASHCPCPCECTCQCGGSLEACPCPMMQGYKQDKAPASSEASDESYTKTTTTTEKMQPTAEELSTSKQAGKADTVKDSPETLSKAEKATGAAHPEGPTSKGQEWDAGKDMFKSDKVPSDDAKKDEVGREASLEKGEQTLSEAEGGPKAHPKPAVDKDFKARSDEEKAKEIGREAKLEPGEQTLSDAEKPAAKDAFKPTMGSEKEVPSDEQKKKEVGREASVFADGKSIEIGEGLVASKDSTTNDIVIKRADKEVARYPDAFGSDPEKVTSFLEALFDSQNRAQKLLQEREAALQKEKFERALESKMSKCKQLVRSMVERELLAVDQALVEGYIKEGQTLLDARQSALRDTMDKQLATFMQLPNELLQVQAEAIQRIKRTAGAPSNKLNIAPHAEFKLTGSDTEWMDQLPWS